MTVTDVYYFNRDIACQDSPRIARFSLLLGSRPCGSLRTIHAVLAGIPTFWSDFLELEESYRDALMIMTAPLALPLSANSPA